VFNIITTLLVVDGETIEEREAVLDQLSAEAAAIFAGAATLENLIDLRYSGKTNVVSSVLGELGISSAEFNGDIESELGNQRGFAGGSGTTDLPLNSFESYNPNSVLELLGEEEDLVNLVILDYIIDKVSEPKSMSDFQSWLKTSKGQEATRDLLNLILENNTGVFDSGSTELNTGTSSSESINDALNKAAGNIPDDPEDGEAKSDDITDGIAMQCVLLQLIEPLSRFCDDELKEKLHQQTLDGIPYSGRIVKLNCDEPSNFVNYVSSVEGVKESFTDVPKDIGAKQSLGILDPVSEFRLSFVKEHDGKLYELPIFYDKEKFSHSLVGGGVEQQYETEVEDTPFEVTKPTSGDSTESITALRPQGIDFLDREFTDLVVEVSYAGTNPATYRNDVEVSVSLSSNALQNYLQNWTYPGLTDVSTGEIIKFNLFDLILFPNLEKNSEGYGRVFKSQFSPSYNRIRLAYLSDVQDNSDYKSFYSKNCNVLDLTPIDHELKRDEEGKSYILTITYRGYVQSVMTSPETDALSDERTKLKREERDILLQTAVEKGCSLRELQKIQTELNTLAQADVKDVSTDLLTNLYKREDYAGVRSKIDGLGIYKLNVSNNVQQSLVEGDKVSLSAIKKRLVSSNRRVVTSGTTGTSLAQGALAASEDPRSEGFRSIYFFYLADLLDTVLLQSGLFNNTNHFGDPINPKRMKQQLRFLLGPFRDPEGNIINIGNIPISVDFFKEWYKENVTAKELYIYPCLAFIRDITERVVTNLLNEVCFEGIDNTKLIVRSSFFTGVKSGSSDRIIDAFITKYANKNIKSLDINSTNEITDDLPMVQVGFRNNVSDYINYCVVSTRQSRDQLTSEALNVEIPEFILEGNYYGSQKVNFSRNTQTGLRESRFFRNSNSGITMLASVYNATLNLDRPIHTFYPNQIIKIKISSGGQTIKVGDTEKSIFTELGIDGYYVITKVRTTLSPREGADKTTLEALWISSFDPYYNIRPKGTTTSITDPTEEAKNNLCNAYVRYSKEISINEALPDSLTIEEGIEAVEQSVEAAAQEAAAAQVRREEISQQTQASTTTTLTLTEPEE
jgi:hypothetical protein